MPVNMDENPSSPPLLSHGNYHADTDFKRSQRVDIAPPKSPSDLDLDEMLLDGTNWQGGPYDSFC